MDNYRIQNKQIVAIWFKYIDEPERIKEEIAKYVAASQSDQAVVETSYAGCQMV